MAKQNKTINSNSGNPLLVVWIWIRTPGSCGELNETPSPNPQTTNQNLQSEKLRDLRFAFQFFSCAKVSRPNLEAREGACVRDKNQNLCALCSTTARSPLVCQISSSQKDTFGVDSCGRHACCLCADVRCIRRRGFCVCDIKSSVFQQPRIAKSLLLFSLVNSISGSDGYESNLNRQGTAGFGAGFGPCFHWRFHGDSDLRCFATCGGSTSAVRRRIWPVTVRLFFVCHVFFVVGGDGLSKKTPHKSRSILRRPIVRPMSKTLQLFGLCAQGGPPRFGRRTY